MNIQDRRRVASLIEGEFNARRGALRTNFSEADVEQKAKDIAKAMKLTPVIAKLEKLRDQVSETEKQLAESASKIRGAKAIKRYRNGCECHGDFQEMLTNAAKLALEEECNKEEELRKLRSDERRLLAEVESAGNVEDVRRILKKAGLIL